MALTVTLLGTSYSIPETGDVGFDAALTAYLKALAVAFPQLSGGLSSLTAELDFGTSFGVKAAWYKSETALPASIGQLRLAKTDKIDWRNNANSGDLALGVDTADALTFGGANVTGNPMLGASTAAAQSITNSVVTIVVFGTIERDSDSGYNSGTGRYTVPIGKGGDYDIIGEIAFGAALTATDVHLSIFKNAAEMKKALIANPAGSQTLSVAGKLNLAAGDIIDIRVFQNSAGASALSASALLNYFALKRIPT